MFRTCVFNFLFWISWLLASYMLHQDHSWFYIKTSSEINKILMKTRTTFVSFLFFARNWSCKIRLLSIAASQQSIKVNQLGNYIFFKGTLMQKQSNMLKLAYFLRNLQISRANNSRSLRIQNAKFSGYCLYMNTNI